MPFPGVSGPEVLNFFHWLGAVITNPMIIGNKWTPVRKVVDRAASMVNIPKLCFCLVVTGTDLAGVFAGSPEEAWARRANCRVSCISSIKKSLSPLSSRAHRGCITTFWTGGKCM